MHACIYIYMCIYSLGVHKRTRFCCPEWPWEPKWLQDLPQEPPGHPQTLILMCFPYYFQHFLLCFCVVSCVFCAMDFAKARWREGRRQLDIYIYMYVLYIILSSGCRNLLPYTYPNGAYREILSKDSLKDLKRRFI